MPFSIFSILMALLLGLFSKGEKLNDPALFKTEDQKLKQELTNSDSSCYLCLDYIKSPIPGQNEEPHRMTKRTKGHQRLIGSLYH